MPYEKLIDLPVNVRAHLPENAQEIYRASFNSIWEQYNHEEEWPHRVTWAAVRAHRIAWAVVKEQYEKDEKTGNWRKKNQS
ncbi:MAG TPA: ChaB family protein [Syntrophales bacterium]|nr:ChaB family protein [Syntrophales bacterium]